ncbi:MAG: DUF362 domain-containing protein [Deltaproteobacteria bacterium]|nr:DUF362 domain-containing protein [Deltaproteobacteria bacterium]
MERTVSIVRYKPGERNVEKAISLCGGAEGLKSHFKVMIKPNVVIGGRLYKNLKKGVVINAEVLEELIVFLKDFGCTDISIGDGSVQLPELGATTETAFLTSGITELAERYGLKLLDFYQHPFKKVTLGGKRIEISVPVLEADYVVNMPVLKAHNQTQVSLSIKNLKGALNFPSKKNFHKFGLDRYIALLGTYLRPHLNIVDGLYSLNKGPVSADWQEVGVLLAGNDPLAVDIVGTKVLGFEPSDVGHLREYAAITGESLDIGKIAITGESLEDVQVTSEWETTWDEMMSAFNVKGVSIITSGAGVCSSCGFAMSRALYMVFRDLTGQSFQPVQFVVGEVAKIPEISQTMLLGKCAINMNKGAAGSIRVKGCPPNVNDVYAMVKEYLTTGACTPSQAK